MLRTMLPHTQGADQQHQGEGGYHAGIVQRVHPAGLDGIGLVVGVGLQVVPGDQEGSHRSADEGTQNVAHRTGGHTHLRGVLRRAHLDENGAEGRGGAYAAGHGGRGALQPQQGVHPDEVRDRHAHNVLQGDEQAGGQGDLHTQLAAGVLQQLGAEAVAHAHEEDILAQVLDGAHVKGQGYHAGALDHGHQNGEQQTGHHRCGNGEFPQGC